MSPTPSVSVVIPTYNRATTILPTLLSVQSQDFPDFECLIVDDGSSDVERLTSIVKALNDDRFSVISQTNQGGNVARNTGIGKAHGKYIALLDSDDIFFPTHLSESIKHLDPDNDRLLVYGRILVDRGDGKEFYKPHRSMRSGEHVSEYLLSDGGFIQTSTIVIHKSLATEVQYDPELRFGQDTDFAIRLAAAGASFFMIEKPLVRWLDVANPNRVSSSTNAEARLAWLSRVQQFITRRARLSDEGWKVAKFYAQNGKKLRAAHLYLRALLFGCYSPKQAVRIVMQIYLPTSLYRAGADFFISKLKKT